MLFFCEINWNYFFSLVNFSWVLPSEVRDLFEQWNVLGIRVRGKAFWACLIHVVLWGIWRERNLRIFQGKSNCCNVVIDSIILEVGSWLFVKGV